MHSPTPKLFSFTLANKAVTTVGFASYFFHCVAPRTCERLRKPESCAERGSKTHSHTGVTGLPAKRKSSSWWHMAACQYPKAHPWESGNSQDIQKTFRGKRTPSPFGIRAPEGHRGSAEQWSPLTNNSGSHLRSTCRNVEHCHSINSSHPHNNWLRKQRPSEAFYQKKIQVQKEEEMGQSQFDR